MGLPSKENLVRAQTDEEMVAARARVHRWREVNKLVKLKEVGLRTQSLQKANAPHSQGQCLQYLGRNWRPE